MYSRDILVAQTDPERWASVQVENARQEKHIEPIDSENCASPAMMAAQGAQLKKTQIPARTLTTLGTACPRCPPRGHPLAWGSPARRSS